MSGRTENRKTSRNQKERLRKCAASENKSVFRGQSDEADWPASDDAGVSLIMQTIRGQSDDAATNKKRQLLYRSGWENLPASLEVVLSCCCQSCGHQMLCSFGRKQRSNGPFWVYQYRNVQYSTVPINLESSLSPS